MTEVKLSQPETVKSKNYPECCEKGNYLIQYADQGQGYIRMEFNDLDLPPNSELLVSYLADLPHQ